MTFCIVSRLAPSFKARHPSQKASPLFSRRKAPVRCSIGIHRHGVGSSYTKGDAERFVASAARPVPNAGF
jgi:hypothetical protein